MTFRRWESSLPSAMLAFYSRHCYNTSYGKYIFLIITTGDVTTMKKAGSFFFTFVPALLALGLQFAVMFFAIGVSSLTEFLWYSPSKKISFSEISTDLSVLWSSQRFNTGIMILFSISCIAVFGLWYYSRYEGNFLPKPSAVFHPVSILGLILLAPAAQYLSSYLISFISVLFPSWLESYQKLMENAGTDGSSGIGMIFYIVLLAPVSEELIFRGVTLRQAKKALPFWAANLFQAVLFGAFHMNMIQGIYACCLGLLLGYICEKSGSIYNSILLHFLFNLLGTVLSGFLTMGTSALSLIACFLVSLLAGILGIFLFRLGAKKTAQRNAFISGSPSDNE